MGKMGRPSLLSPEQKRYVTENHTVKIPIKKGDGIDGRRHEKKDHSKLSTEELALKFNVHFSVIKRALDHGRYRICLDKTNRTRKLLIKKIKQKCIEYKGGCCSKCAYKACARALDFHHLDQNTKSFTVAKYFASKPLSSLIDKNEKISLPNILVQELDKCILLCANCHRELHDSKEEV